MKALSLKQPWAELILQKKKKIEIRKWNTNFRGEFLIHASKNPDMNAMKKFNFKISELPLGFIVGKAKLIDVKKYESEQDFQNHKKCGHFCGAEKKNFFEQDKDLHLATKDFGYYGFILDNVKRVKPIRCNGKLNFWDFKE